MTTLPAAYQWLASLPTRPKMVDEALKLLGTVETPGAGNAPIIMAWAKEVGVDKVYSADAIPWCGLFMALVAKRAGKSLPVSPLWALSWAKWELDGGQPDLGDVLVFQRTGGGHVGIYVGEDTTAFHVLGGNQSDSVCITRVAKNRLYAVRQPTYSIAKPPTAKPYILQGGGRLSSNEA